MDERKDQVTAETDFSPLPVAVDDKFSYWSVEKVYIQAEPRVGTTVWRIGFNLEPPAGKQVVVAIPLDGKPSDKTPDFGAMNVSSFQRVLETCAKAVVEEFNNLTPKEGF